ncbi:MAG: hypothetical protein RIQ56_796, partial [Candidatus Parcubacteria bacterium]
ENPRSDMPSESQQTVYVDGNKILADVVKTETDRARGLGGRESLTDDTGMLFLFPEDGYHSFWMKDMRFSIDILWLSATGTIVHIEPSVSPDTYPRSFSSLAPARYVLELPAGFSSQHDIRVGEDVRW